MKKTSRSIPSKRRLPAIIILMVIIAGAIILLLLKNSGFDNKKTILTESNPKQIPNATTYNPFSEEPSTLPHDIPPPPMEEPISPPAEAVIPQKNTPCQDLSANLHKLFAHLNQEKYIEAYTQNEPVEAELNRVISNILNNPPTNANETADLLSVIRNSSHLFRVLGRKDLSFLKEIITHEHASMEQHLATLYAWSTRDKACRDSSAIKLDLPLAQTYEYAAFFLNTLGGQSYLSRRDTKLRTLTKYYCVLILDQAASQSLNKYDISLAYHLDSILNDIASSDFLENQGAYITTLTKIKNQLHTQKRP